MRTIRTIILFVVMLAVFGLALSLPAGQQAQAQGANLLRNPSFEEGFYTFDPDDYNWVALYPSQREDCKMDNGTYLPCNTAQTPLGWIPWWISQTDEDPDWKNRMPEYKPAEPPFMDRIHSGNRAAQYFTFHSTHTAGLLQVVDVPENAQVRFSIWGQAWSSASDASYSDFPTTVNMRIGIDPTGSTNPYNPAIVWSDYQQPYDAYQQFVVEAQAQGSRVTVFTISSPDEARKHNDIYWDDAVLEVIGEAAPPPPPTATTAPSGEQTGDDSGGQTGDNSDAGSGNDGSAAQVAAQPGVGPTATPDAEGVIYVEVQEGDSYWSIAARHGLTIDEIYELNNAGEGDFVQPGQRLVVGHAEPSAPEASEEEGDAAEDAEAADEEAEAEPTAQPTAAPTATEAPRMGEVCLTAFVDENRNAQRDAGEPLQSSVAFTVYDGEQVLANYITDGASEPYCMALEPGNYRITRSKAANEELTTDGEWAISISGGSSQSFEFGGYMADAVADAGESDSENAGENNSEEALAAANAEDQAQESGGVTRLIVIAAVVVAVLLLVGVLIIILSARRSTV
ncbi:MAG TPA: LysM domain-containing protein [Candidatus Sulfomarinibacteraceae bacterium]|nr:LysM domain-containing protein [Candidatus Sulfomarinibacteraceae bacterium]